MAGIEGGWRQWRIGGGSSAGINGGYSAEKQYSGEKWQLKNGSVAWRNNGGGGGMKTNNGGISNRKLNVAAWPRKLGGVAAKKQWQHRNRKRRRLAWRKLWRWRQNGMAAAAAAAQMKVKNGSISANAGGRASAKAAAWQRLQWRIEKSKSGVSARHGARHQHGAAQKHGKRRQQQPAAGAMASAMA
jgi:hypothetical protein